MSEISERLAKLPPGRRAEFLALLRAELEGPAHEQLIPRPRVGPAPLSYAQETLWFLEGLAPGLPTYNVPIWLRLRGELDPIALRAALADVVRRHESLRTYFMEQAEGPVQVTEPDVPVELPVVDLAGEEAETRPRRAEELATEAARLPFDLTAVPLWRARVLRLAPDDHMFVFVVHHIVFDGWSLNVFGRDLAEAYRARREGREPELEPLSVQYPDYAYWQREWLEGESLDKLVDYWRNRLAGASVLEFPTDRPRPAQVTYNGTFLERRLPARLIERVRALASQETVTPFTVYIAAFFVLLHRYTGQDDLVIGSPTANRGRPQVRSLIGYFINMLVLRGDLSGDPAFREVVGQLRSTVQEAFANGELPFGKMVAAIRPVRDPSRSPLFQIAYTMRDAEGPVPELPGLKVTQRSADPGTSRFDMSWNAGEGPGGLDLTIEFNTDLFDRATVERLIAHYEHVLDAVTAGPGSRASAVPLLSEQERQALLRDAGSPRREVPDVTVPELFGRQVARARDAVALVADGRELSYGELDVSANRLARLLHDHGAKPGELVAVCLPRTAGLVVAVLGILKSGAAYLPLDPSHPPARLAGIVDDARPCAVVTDDERAGLFPADRARLVRIDSADLARQPGGAPATGPRPGDVAYVLYTSGSTGRPKGVLIEHRNVVNFIASVRELFGLTTRDRMLGYAAITFDVSVFEIFSALLTGARLYLATDEERLTLDRLQSLMESAGITVIDMPPSVMALLEPERLGALRVVFVGGEAFGGELVNRWNQGRRFFNGYGPTECTVTMIVEECPGTWTGSPPIGRPMVNHVAHVVDRYFNLVPYGVAGELVIGGAGLARGYLNRPGLTAESFVDDPFATAPGGRLYRTGDLVRRLPDGRLVFHGRIDQQVKIRGSRIELGEVESVLTAHDKVGQAAARPWTDGRGEAHLVAYVTPAGTPGLELSELRSYLASRLPTYMIPAYFVELDQLPLNASGKVDRAALPAPDTSRPTGSHAPPRTGIERALAEEVFAPVLGLPQVGIHDNFFEFGGNSLQAARLISGIRRRFGVEIRLADFFRSPTVANLAVLVDRERLRGMSDEEMVKLVEAMPEEEVARLLGDREAGG
jgi:amino acid adenylation domain-containing protein